MIEEVIGQCRQGTARVGKHVGKPLPGFGMRVEDGDVPAVQQEPGRPAAADDAAAQQGSLAAPVCRGTHRGARFVSSSLLRTDSGVITVAPRSSMILTAFSTSWALVASSPLRR